MMQINTSHKIHPQEVYDAFCYKFLDTMQSINIKRDSESKDNSLIVVVKNKT